MMNIKRLNIICIIVVVSCFVSSCSGDANNIDTEMNQTGRLISMSFMEADNPRQLISDIDSNIIGDSLVECWIRNIVEDKVLIPQIKYQGATAMINGQFWKEGKKVDFTTPVTLTINGSGGGQVLYC